MNEHEAQLKLFRALLDQSNDAIEVVDPETLRFLDVNEKACRDLGYSRQELMNLGIFDIDPSVDESVRAKVQDELSKSGFVVMETCHRRKDGSVFPVEVSIKRVQLDRAYVVTVARDITQRRRAGDALREREMRYRGIVETTNDGVWLLDSNFCNSYVNRQLAEMLGYEAKDMLGRSVFEFYFPEDVERKKQVLNRRRQGLREQIEERLRRKDGSELWVRIAGTPVFRDDGEFDGALAMVSDITERRRAEQALRESEERFRLAAQAGHMFAYSWDATTDVIERSGESAKILGIDEATPLTGLQAIGRVHPDEREALQAAMGKLSPEKPFLQASYRIVRPDETVVWVERQSRAYFDEHGKIKRIVGMVVDITERKRSEETLRQSEEKFRSVFREAGVGMVIVSPEGHFLAANTTFCECLGYTEGELLDKTVQSVTYHEDWPAFSQKLREALTEGCGFQNFEKRCLHKSGRIVYTDSSASLIRDAEGAPQYFVGEVLDVTKRKEAEEAVSGMTRKLVEAQEQERTRIARELHDDIIQRLAVLAIELRRFRDELADLPREVRDHLHELQLLTEVISTDVYALSHELHSSTLECLGLVTGMRSWCKEFGERQKLEIDFKSHDVPKPPQEISLCLFRVLQEALHNAAKHSGAKQIEVQLTENSGEIHLIVNDSGKGFDVESAMRSRGLGLTSMHERVRLVGGTILIDSGPLAGTTVHVCVPFRAKSSAQMAAR